MNAEGRKKLEAIASDLRTLVTSLEEIRDEEQEKFDNLSEGLQQAEKGQAIEQSVADLEDAIASANEAADKADDAKGS